MAEPDAARIASLDVIRGVAVMGILVANLPAFALPEAAYFSPLAWGGTAPADIAAWFATFVLVEGKMRGLFSFLFGASMLLVMDRAAAAGDDPAAVHFRRMAALFAIGCAHLYLFWWGDILSHYALVGAIAFMFARLPVRWLLAVGAMLVGWQVVSGAELTIAAFSSVARATPGQTATWTSLTQAFGIPPAPHLAAEIAALRGGFVEGIGWRWREAWNPIAFLPIGGAETLGYMLWGMAGLRSGFLTEAWPRRRYRLIALGTLGISWPLYALLAAGTLRHGFDMRYVVLASIGIAPLLRPMTIVGYAALIMLAMRPGGALTARVAAAGRAAFTNYLGTTLLMTFVFSGWGAGQFARWSRGELYLIVPFAWTIMLAWSRPWLARYRFGPLEWAWRSLARSAWQPMRRSREHDESIANATS